MKTRRMILAAVAAAALCLSCSGRDKAASAPESDAGGGRADRFYVVNTLGESLSVIDQASRSVMGTIALGNQPHGQAPSSAGDFIYVTTDSGKGEVIAVGTATNTVAWRIDAGSRLNEPHLTNDDRLLYAPDLLAAQVAVVDVQARSVVTKIPMVDDAGGNLVALHNVYASHDGLSMYVTAIVSKKIARIDLATNTISRIYSLSGQPRPAVVAPGDDKMYVQLSELHGFVELDLGTGEESRRIEWPEPATPPPGFDQAEDLPTKCHGIGITPDGKELWAATGLEGAVYVYSLPDLAQLARFDVGNFPNWIAFSSDGSTGYVTNTDPLAAHGTVSVVDVGKHAVTATLDVGKAPKRIHLVELPPPPGY